VFGTEFAVPGPAGGDEDERSGHGTSTPLGPAAGWSRFHGGPAIDDACRRSLPAGLLAGWLVRGPRAVLSRAPCTRPAAEQCARSPGGRGVLAWAPLTSVGMWMPCL
jgi:hypothetical protein